MGIHAVPLSLSVSPLSSPSLPFPSFTSVWWFLQQMAEKIGESMEKKEGDEHGVRFIKKCVPTKVRRLFCIRGRVLHVMWVWFQVELVEEGPPRRLRVEFKSTETGEVKSEEFNTVSHMIVM